MAATNAADLLAVRAAREKDAVGRALGLDKQDDLTYDLSRLCAFDIGALDAAAAKADQDAYISKLTRNNVQLLVHHIFSCPSEDFENGRIARLPNTTFPLPRAKPVPVAREPTRWEKFAKEKGIMKKKKGKMVFNEDTKEYAPRFGYKRADNKEEQWLIEAADDEKPGDMDPFLKAREDKKARVTKEKKKQDRNILERTNPELAKQVYQHAPQRLSGDDRLARKKMQNASIELTQVSTGSLGKFDNRVAGEKKPKPLERAKREPVIINHDEEKARTLKMLDKVIGDHAEINTQKAANKYIAFTQQQNGDEKRKKGGNGAGGREGKRRRK